MTAAMLQETATTLVGMLLGMAFTHAFNGEPFHTVIEQTLDMSETHFCGHSTCQFVHKVLQKFCMSVAPSGTICRLHSGNVSNMLVMSAP